MNLESIENRIAKFGNELNEELMKDVITPFCIKYHLHFLAAMGTYVFSNHKGTIIDSYDVDKKKNKSIFWKEFSDIVDMIWAVDDISKFLGSGHEYKGE